MTPVELFFARGVIMSSPDLATATRLLHGEGFTDQDIATVLFELTRNSVEVAAVDGLTTLEQEDDRRSNG